MSARDDSTPAAGVTAARGAGDGAPPGPGRHPGPQPGSQPGRQPGHSRRRPGGALRAAGLLVACVVALAAVERGVHELRGRWSGTGGQARWIWAALDPEAAGGQRAVAFFAYRDVELEAPPRRARLLVAADEAYIVWLNGGALGSAETVGGTELAPFDVSDRLVAGTNRLVLELRSGRGVGGFMARLEVDGRPLPAAATGAAWRVVRSWRESLMLPGEPVEGEERPTVGSSSPTGRWGTPEVASSPPDYDRLLTAPEPLAAARALLLGAQLPWRDLDPFGDWRSPVLGRRVSFDWRREVAGYLNVYFADTGGARGLVWFGATPQQARKRPADALIVNPPGRTSWSTAEPRFFRYITVESSTEVRGARVILADPEGVRSRRAGAGDPEGVFGIDQPPPVPMPAEDAIRRELDALGEFRRASIAASG